MESYFIHGDNVSPRWDYSHHINPPITQSVAFRLESAERGAAGFSEYAKLSELSEHPIYLYERLDEPTTGMLEDRLAAAEGGESAVAFSTGMAAISAIICILTKNGDHIVSHDSIYGCTYSLFSNWMPRRGTDVTFVNMAKDKDWMRCIKDDTRIIYYETPVNPTMDLIDIEAVSKIAAEINKNRPEEKRIYTIVDNTFASPFCQRPLLFGTDIVVASLTKHLCGFGTSMGGVVVAPQRFRNPLFMYRKDFGGSLHGRSAWPILVYGIPTLAIRLKREMETATKLAHFLASHPKVRAVHYPGLETYPHYKLAKKQMASYDGSFAPGSVLYFILNGKPQEAKKKGIKLIDWLAKNSISYTLAVSLGCVKTLVEQPSSMTHAAIPLEEQLSAGIEPGGIRLSIGLEDSQMLQEELSRALDQI
jgi:cystathionine beta-lyase/cystathionine gamma-synthase